jgi:hypothetical protein
MDDPVEGIYARQGVGRKKIKFDAIRGPEGL